ncbi:hypothetical protein GPECTOR_38g292 [Gonium pectorale]|uniref:CMP/dCMP-type deaminase domain-containing protein n=1 Tax=Gonium pectorale TaxID=33097 RepID=A0A150GBY0_GONPE|nr:hypothetical protein GPECTOR_38g292 [Gonium pectorale]|eukprot:KXZ47055.1 hypothetical protein GPECTOR_38g292 [Gonium pectorale]
MASTADFLAAVQVPSKQELPLRTLPLAVAAFSSKVGNQLIKALGNAAPLADQKHLKRVRKAPDDGALLEAILCVLPDDAVSRKAAGATGASAEAQAEEATVSGGHVAGTGCGTDVSPDLLPEALRDLYMEQGGVRLRLLHGAAYPPQTRQQWEAWTKLWPITWRIPDHGTPVTEETPVDQATQRYFEHHMRLALQLAAASSADNAALIVSPPSLTPLAEAVDGSGSHPLRHAVMAAIQVASERDLALWPPSVNDEPQGMEAMAIAAPIADPGLRTSSGSGAGPASADGASAGRQEDGPAVQGFRAGVTAEDRASAAAAGEELASKRPRLGAGPHEAGASRPYMCTGYDCFVVMEPCIMCSMALVHSRVQRVIYCRPDPQHGALGGERRLHACRSLNHNYEVFRIELKS